ncbi:MAG: hypothetical protein HYV28_10625, partial [Ignavibacteriales bacterium]|nr:hypothetical protein [Ignavibacteriales bacterium]
MLSAKIKLVTPLLCIILFCCGASAHAQALFQGPAAGQVGGGATVSTGLVENNIIGAPLPRVIKNKFPFNATMVNEMPERAISEGIKYYSADNTLSPVITDTATTFLLQNFAGVGQTNSIPPDPHLAVGPSHIIATVNSDFAIFDKNGNKLFTTSAANWYSSVLVGTSPFDPKVIYDQYAKRWFMVWLDQNDGKKTGHFLISVSDDSIPLGKWHNYALPSHVNGMTFDNTWSDYQGVGYDDKAFYITGDQFSFSGFFAYTKIRVIPKQQLLTDTVGTVTWQDFWDIRDPGSMSNAVFNIRPSLSLSTADAYYLCHSPYYGTNYVILYRITGLPENPVLSAQRVSVTAFSSPPTPVQLGSNSISLEGSSSGLTNEPVFLNGMLWGVHTVSNPAATSYSAFHYFGINTNNGVTVKQGFFGQDGYYYMYPSLMVDKNANLLVTYSRCGVNDYIGAYFASCNSNSNTINGSYTLKPGKGNYIKDFGSGRNRWGDYMGICLDPADAETYWMLTEYASAMNTWDTWIGAARVAPFQGSLPFAVTPQIDFSNVEVGFESTVQEVSIANFGNTAFTIDSISYNKTLFSIVPFATFPSVMHSLDTLILGMKFKPVIAQQIADTLRFYSAGVVTASIPLFARGFVINPAPVNVSYGVSNGKVLQINKNTGAPQYIGESNFLTLNDIAIHPKTGTVFGVARLVPSGSEIVRVNASGGDAYSLCKLPDVSAVTCAFDTAGNFFLASRSGVIYYCNLPSGQLYLMDTAKCNITAMVFHPFTNQLWASVYKPVGSGRDRIVKINMQNGDTTLIGQTGLTLYTQGLFFDEYGTLFGVKSAGNTSDYFTIDTTTGTASVIGSIPYPSMTGLEYNAKKTTGVEQISRGNTGLLLSASHYPNPFN